MTSTSYYEVLGVSMDASEAEIKRAFRSFSRKNHPDMGGDEQAFKQGSEAYETLSDEGRRHAYDRDVLGKGAKHSGSTPFGDGHDDATADETTFTTDSRGSSTPSSPPPARAKAAAASTQTVSVVTGSPDYRILGTALCVIGFIQAIVAAHGSPTGLFVGFAAGVIAGIWGVDRLRIGRWRYSATTAIITIVVLALATTIPAWLFLPEIVRPVSTLVVFAAIAMILLPSVRAERRDAKVFSMSDLRESNLFGNAAPGAASATSEQIIAETLVSRPDVRVVRRPAENGFFTHALICGDHAVFLRGVEFDGGDYWWHGSSLVRRSRSTGIEEIVRGDYDGVVHDIDEHTPGVEVMTAIVALYAPDVGYDSHGALPKVIAPDGLAALVDAMPHGTVNRRVCVEVVQAWHDADV